MNNGDNPREGENQTTDIAFSNAVKRVQDQMGSRAQMEQMSRVRGFQTKITEPLKAFIADCDSFFLATSSLDGQPYVQHRGGPKGFLEVVSETRLQIEDYAGNRQFITLGNLSENPKVHLIVVDFESQRRVKIWAKAQTIEDGKQRRVEFEVTAWDFNCRKHIPKLLADRSVNELMADSKLEIERLQAQIMALSKRLSDSGITE